MIYNFDIADTGLSQGDIFQGIDFNCDGEIGYCVLITPECDLVVQQGRTRPKAQYLLFVRIASFDDILSNIISQLKITKKQREGEEKIDEIIFGDLIEALKRFFNGAIFPQFFYLPPIEGFFGHSVINFQIVEARKTTQELLEDLKRKRIAKIRSSWKEAVPVRFSNYTSRIGVEDLSDNYIDEIFKNYKINFSIIR